MLPPHLDPYRLAIRELQCAADGEPTGYDFSELAEIALVRVTLSLGHAPDTRTHLLLAIQYLERAMTRTVPGTADADRPGAISGPGPEQPPTRRPSQRVRPIRR